MKEIILNNNFKTLVDDEDFEKVSTYTWTVDKHGRTWYATRWIQHNNKRTKIYLHRFLMPDTIEVDHKDCDGLNNQRYNLRPADTKSNKKNTRAHADSTSLFKGVSWETARKKWVAQIYVSGKNLSLGRFANQELAAKAYDIAALRHFGDFARTNEMMNLYSHAN